jgi:glycine/D-amino acid oxidase-like deaminating enzyme
MPSSVAIVGGGLQGCLAALALAADGHRVAIFERRQQLLQGASRNNEGKIHLGYTYGLDPSTETTRLLLASGVRFYDLLGRLLDRETASLINHRRAIYALHRGSLLSPAAADAHVRNVDRLHRQMLAELALTAPEPLRLWSTSETRDTFGPDIGLAYEVAEDHIDWLALCDEVGTAIAVAPRIAVHTATRVLRIDQTPRPTLIGEYGTEIGGADFVVNCAWEDLARLARASGVTIDGLCLRAKAGFIAGAASLPSSPVTFCFGAYGDIVPLGRDRTYLSWYPACLAGFTASAEDGADWYEGQRAEFDLGTAYRDSARHFASLCPHVTFAETYDRAQIGPILAQGRSDIVDPHSGLHRRTAIGISGQGRLLSINTGKIAAAPTFALALADMLR